MKFEESPPLGVTPEDWQKYLEYSASREKELKARFEEEFVQSPPKPPWLKYPEYEPTDLFWRMGDGEGYLSDYIAVYFKYASPEDLRDYKANYPEPEEWQGWYKCYQITP